MSTGLEIRVRVIQKRLEAEGIVSLWLAPEPGISLPGFAAGAHIDVETAPGLVRQYSLCNPGKNPACYAIAVLREPASRGGSAALHERVQVGEHLRISAPRNHFALEPHDPAPLLLAGGIGVTPIMAMATELEAAGRPYRLHYCARSPDRAAFAQQLAELACTGSVQVHYDDGPEAQRLDLGTVLREANNDNGLYVCGPAGFIDWVLDGARKEGWTANAIHREYFAGPAAAADLDGDRPFTIHLARSGRDVAVAADETIAAALERVGVFVPISCAEGICGTCVVGMLDGEGDHRDFVLSEEDHAANRQITVCCSRARGDRLTLDL